ncbi:MAG: hypothetical protein U9Q99_03175 [Nanoarchaeota archaeon]|nr:hypothetical protein [Nanoarchaeota archaeon]
MGNSIKDKFTEREKPFNEFDENGNLKPLYENPPNYDFNSIYDARD